MRAGSVEEAHRGGAGLRRAGAEPDAGRPRDASRMKTIGAMPAPRSAATRARAGCRRPAGCRRTAGRASWPYAANPEFVDPEGGILGNTNNKIVDRPFPLHVSYDWGDTQRIQRWRRLMQSREVHTRESFIEAQLDTVSFTARSLLPLIARGPVVHRRRRARGHAGAAPPARARPARRLERRDERAPARAADLRRVDARAAGPPDPRRAGAARRRVRPSRAGLPRAGLPRRRRRLGLVRRHAVDRRRDLHGHGAPRARRRAALDRRNLRRPLESLRWGDAHEATHDHPVLGEIPILRWFVNIRQSTIGGDHTLLRGLHVRETPRRRSSTSTARATAASTTSPTPNSRSSSSPPASPATRCRATTTTWASSGGAANTSRCRSTPSSPAPPRSA